MKFLNFYPLPAGAAKREAIWNRLKAEVSAIKEDKYERPILKIFDFTLWIESKLTQTSPGELLGKRQ